MIGRLSGGVPVGVDDVADRQGQGEGLGETDLAFPRPVERILGIGDHSEIDGAPECVALRTDGMTGSGFVFPLSACSQDRPRVALSPLAERDSWWPGSVGIGT